MGELSNLDLLNLGFFIVTRFRIAKFSLCTIWFALPTRIIKTFRINIIQFRNENCCKCKQKLGKLNQFLFPKIKKFTGE